MSSTKSDIFNLLSASSPLLFAEKNRRNDLRRHLDGTLPAATALRLRARAQPGGARRGDHRESELVAIQLAQAGDPLRDGGRSRTRSPTADQLLQSDRRQRPADLRR